MTTETRAVASAQAKALVQRPRLEEMGLDTGKLVRLKRIYGRGKANGTLLFLPIDQGLEHGPRDFFDNPASLDPEYQWRLAVAGNYSGIALQYGLASKYIRDYAGDVPLVLKLNGKTDIPSDKQPLSPVHTSVEEAVRIGADAVGYTLYVGSALQTEDFIQFGQVRREAERYGMPIIVWSYPRGEAVDAKGGKESPFAIEYAARVACELGADIVKVNMPADPGEKAKASPKPYNAMGFNMVEAFERVVRAAGRTPVLLSGGEKTSDEELFTKAETALQAGATGFIFGRNVWQRSHEQATDVITKLWDLLGKY
ncbi:MAG: class I fructose-bisphosphate aldolase [Dehalococcoidia bacterium]